MIEAFELIATSPEELDELVQFMRSADLELLCVIAIATPAPPATTDGGHDAARPAAA